MSLASASLAAPTMPLSSRIRMLAAILLVVVIAEAIGSLTFTVGPGKIILQPMLWAIFIGAIVAALGQRLPAAVYHFLDAVVHHRHQDFLLAAEMMEQAARLQAHRARQFAHRGALVAVAAEQLPRRQDHLAPALGLRTVVPRRAASRLLHRRSPPLLHAAVSSA